MALIRLIGSTSKDYYRDGMIRIEIRRIIPFFSLINFALRYRYARSPSLLPRPDFTFKLERYLSRWQKFSPSLTLVPDLSLFPKNSRELSVEKISTDPIPPRKRNGIVVYVILPRSFHPFFFRFFSAANDSFRLFTIANEDRE